jgi:hypothetical protein
MALACSGDFQERLYKIDHAIICRIMIIVSTLTVVEPFSTPSPRRQDVIVIGD